MKAIETEYKGYLFRSRLEARWAVFFDACGVKWEYEPEGFDLGDGLYYLPDFLLHDVYFIYRINGIKDNMRYFGDLWVEVKGKMSASDAEKIFKFANIQENKDRSIGEPWYTVSNPILVVANIPSGYTFSDFEDSMISEQDLSYDVSPFKSITVDGDDFHDAFPCITPQGHFAIWSLMSFPLEGKITCIDTAATKKAYKLARQARFEHR